MKKISIVVPCYNEEANVNAVYERILTIFKEIPNHTYEIVFIDNNSADKTVEFLKKLAANDSQVKIIVNARNFGHIRSPYHALMNVTGDAGIIMAADLQDPPELIPCFVKEWEKGFKVVVAVKEKSEEAPLFFLVRRAYYRLVRNLAETDLIENFTGFGLYDRVVIDYCRSVDDPYPYFRGMISEIGFPVMRIPYMQPARKHGFTKNNFFTLYDIAMLGIIKNSKVPLRLATMSGFFLSLLSMLTGFVYLIYKLIFWDRFSAGIAPIIIGLSLFCSVQLFFIGILGEYIGVILTHVRKLPLVVEKERINFE